MLHKHRHALVYSIIQGVAGGYSFKSQELPRFDKVNWLACYKIYVISTFSFFSLTERGSGEHVSRDRGSLRRHARQLPEHNQHAWSRARQRASQHWAAGPGLQDAAGHQDQAGARDCNLQEPAGNRGVQVDTKISMCLTLLNRNTLSYWDNKIRHLTHSFLYLFFPLCHFRPTGTGM